MTGDVRHHLRHSTQTRHAALDGRLSQLRLDRRDGYSQFLVVNAATAPIERLLESHGIAGDLADWPHRARRQAICADLDDLGLPHDAPGGIAGEDAPDLSSPAARLGLAYVTEGSRLGARVLHPMVMGSADPVVRGATRFLSHGRGQDLWRTFVPILEDAVCTADDRARAVAAALWGFDQFLARTAAFEESSP